MEVLYKIIDRGLKFIPIININSADNYLNSLIELDKQFLKLNRQIYIDKLKKENKNQLDYNCNSMQDILPCYLNKSSYKMKQKPIIYDNTPLQEEILNFRDSIINKLPDHYNKYAKNLNYNEIRVLRKFCLNRPFDIIDSDKNTGSVLLNKVISEELAKNHLNDKDVYTQLDYNPLDKVITKINVKLLELYNSKQISAKTFKLLKPSNSRNGKFRMLIKLHKKDLDIRPIINSISHPTERISNLIDLILKLIINL